MFKIIKYSFLRVARLCVFRSTRQRQERQVIDPRLRGKTHGTKRLPDGYQDQCFQQESEEEFEHESEEEQDARASPGSMRKRGSAGAPKKAQRPQKRARETRTRPEEVSQVLVVSDSAEGAEGGVSPSKKRTAQGLKPNNDN
jgi:hypothetical protein